ncbi:DUF4132 domain-containing protein [Nonomuraea terrae]|uniref:DUF4132 domain-containing protein n=1 Tax=Nonomuraea terrae TaxID=2530383 RepID=UPI0037B50E77
MQLSSQARSLLEVLTGAVERFPERLDASRLSAYDLGALLPAAHRVDSGHEAAVLARWEVRSQLLERQPLFTPAACADLFHALVEDLDKRREPRLSLGVGALVRCPEGAPLDQLADPARALVRFIMGQDRIGEPFALLAAAGLVGPAGPDAEVAERVAEGGGPLAAAEVELLLGWNATQRALFMESVVPADYRFTRGFAPLPDARERVCHLPGHVEFARATMEAAEARVAAIHAGEVPYRAEKAFDHAEKATIGRAARVALRHDEPWLPELLDSLVRKVAVAPTQAKTLPSQGVLFAIAHAAEEYPTPEAVASLHAARRETRHAGVPKQLDRMLKRVEAALGNRLEVAFRLPDGRVRRQLGEHTAVISTDGAVELSWWHGDRKLKTVPAAVRREHGEEVARLRALVKQVKQQQATLSRALEAGYAGEVAPPYHQLAGQPIADRLIWEFEASPGQWHSRLGLGVPDVPVRLWHPARASLEEVASWREAVQEKELRQPFKQAFREIYLLTPAEEATEAHSNRFADHMVEYHKLYALFKQRGWQAAYVGPWDGGGDGEARRVVAGGRWRASFSHGYADEGYALTGEVRFHRLTGDRWEPARLTEVPPLVFSEAMRDVDLFVAVTSIATDPAWLDRGPGRLHGHWRTTSFGALAPSAEVRRDALARLLPRLTVAGRCTLTDRFLVVRGDLRTYKIHLGSGNILMEPNDAYLCIVAGPSRDRVFLPFEEDGGLLSVILSKAFLLAADTAIDDPTITRQIRA